MEITGREVRAKECIIKHLPAELLQEMCSRSRRVSLNFIVWQDNSVIKHPAPLVSKTLSQTALHSRGESWNKSLHFQPLQRCYYENSGSPDSVCVMRRHYHVHAVVSRNKWFSSCGTSWKLTLLTVPRICKNPELCVTRKCFS